MTPKDIVSQLRHIANNLARVNDCRFLALNDGVDLIDALEIDPTYYQIKDVVDALRDLAYDIDDAAWRSERDAAWRSERNERRNQCAK